jgi:glycosyltransferase involved in cell wall biosynthesis
MFASLNLRNRRKGGVLLLQALMNLPKSIKSDTVILTMGKGKEEIAKSTGIETINMGYVGDDELKAAAYSASDLFLFPTRADTQGLVLLESLACGTPAVSFGVGGVPEIIKTGETGYLAEPENVEDFCAGIMLLLENVNLRQEMGEKGRKIALQEYCDESQFQRYVQLYNSLL